MEDEPTLEEITNAIFSLREELLGSMTEILVSQKHQEIINQDTISYPGCGRILNSRGLRERTVETMIGKVRINRPFFDCVDCHETYYPLDEQLELSKHRKQWEMQKKETKLVTDLPYERACEHFQELTGLSFSDHAAYEIAKEIGKGLTVISVSPTRKDISQRITEIAGEKKRRPIMVLSIDGSHVPIRPEEARKGRAGRKKKRKNRAHWNGQWREAKGFRIYLINGNRIEHILSWHQIQDVDGIWESLRKVKAAGLIPEDKVRLCVIADGSQWIWNGVSEIFPNAEQVLDLFFRKSKIHFFRINVF